MSNWTLTVGLEIHVQLKTKTKMFCGCKNTPFSSEPNTHVCPVCYGLPGALPLLNRRAIELTIELGQALSGEIAQTTFWARKNYFYPDLPKGYQISQSTAPVINGGVVKIDGHNYHLHHAHLEEDAGKLTHEQGKSYSLVDYNRAGTPLLEIVTEPDFHSSSEAKRFCQEFQRIVRHLNVSDADMEKGQMRCEANISVAPSNWSLAPSENNDSQKPESSIQKLGTKVEVKNINSFRAVEKAIEYEFDRQTNLLENGGVITQETRTWSDTQNKTITMRSKETSADYRYFPEPDLPIVTIEESNNKTHKLPEAERNELAKLGLAKDTAVTIVDRGWFEQLIALHQLDSKLTKEAANMAIAFPGLMLLPVSDQLILLKAKMNAGWAKETFSSILGRVSEGENIEKVLSEFSIIVDLTSISKEVIKANQSAVNDYIAGKTATLNFLVGQVMARTKGQANISKVREELEKILTSS